VMIESESERDEPLGEPLAVLLPPYPKHGFARG
jgi:hypothetical protein